MFVIVRSVPAYHLYTSCAPAASSSRSSERLFVIIGEQYGQRIRSANCQAFQRAAPGSPPPTRFLKRRHTRQRTQRRCQLEFWEPSSCDFRSVSLRCYWAVESSVDLPCCDISQQATDERTPALGGLISGSKTLPILRFCIAIRANFARFCVLYLLRRRTSAT